MFLYTFCSHTFLRKIKKILLEKTTPTMTAGVEKQYEKKHYTSAPYENTPLFVRKESETVSYR